MIKTTVSKVTANPIGAIAGGILAYLVAKKYGKVENKYLLVGIGIAGIVGGAMAQSYIKAKKSVPTATTVGK